MDRTERMLFYCVVTPLHFICIPADERIYYGSSSSAVVNIMEGLERRQIKLRILLWQTIKVSINTRQTTLLRFKLLTFIQTRRLQIADPWPSYEFPSERDKFRDNPE